MDLDRISTEQLLDNIEALRQNNQRLDEMNAVLKSKSITEINELKDRLQKTEVLLNKVDAYNKAAKLALAGFTPEQVDRYLELSLNSSKL